MKKRSLVLVAIFAIAFSACKEIPPFINFEPDVVLLADTSYIASPVPAAEPQNVLIEDISGVRCTNCPDAAIIAHDLLDKNPGRVVVTTIHPNILRGFTFPLDDGEDFRTEEGTNIVKELIGAPQGLPAGSINRTLFPSESFVTLPEGKWAGHVNDFTAVKAEANLSLEVEKDKEARNAKVTAKIIFTKIQTDPVYLTILVTESHIIGPQSTLDNGIVKDYEHNFILRKSITPYFGVKLDDQINQNGQAFEKGFEVPIDAAWDYDNCSIVVIVNRHGDTHKEVIQVTSYDLKD